VSGIRRNPHAVMVSRDSRIAKVLTAETAAKFLRWCHSPALAKDRGENREGTTEARTFAPGRAERGSGV